MTRLNGLQNPGTTHDNPASSPAARPPDISESELSAFVSGLPRAYAEIFAPATMYTHLRLARGIQPHQVHVALDQHPSGCELTAVGLESPFLFCNIAGVLSYFGMDIQRGREMTTPQDLVLAVFEFTDAEGFIGTHRGALRRIRRMLEAAAGGAVDMIELMREKARALPAGSHPPSAPAVDVKRLPDDPATVVGIVADDAPGLLYRISRVIVHAGFSVDLARISTEEGKALDTLHVTRDRQALSDVEQTTLQQDLERVLTTGRR